MPERKGKKMLTVWIDQEDQEALQTLCRTNGTSVSSVLRNWILISIQEQSTKLAPLSQEEAGEPSSHHSVGPEVLKELMTRLAALEQAMPKFDVTDLVRMREEILSGEFGSLRYRMGIVEAQVHSLGGSIAWKTKNTKRQETQ